MKIDKVVRVGRGRSGDVFCHIKFDGERLSITGVEGPKSNGNCIGSCGQIVMHEWDIQEYSPDWDENKVRQFRELWDRWHLNDMRAGTPKQMRVLDEQAEDYPGFPVSHYVWACNVLEEAGCYNDGGYKYGSAWLKEEVPLDVLEWFELLPDTDLKPAWV